MGNVASKVGVAAVVVIMGCFLAVNLLGGLISGVWLLIEGEWRLVIAGIGLSIAMPWGWSICSLPAMGLLALAVARSETPSRWSIATLGLTGAVWTSLLIGMWCILVFGVFMSRAGEGTIVPLLLWTYATTMSPLAYMAKMEPEDSLGANVGILLAIVNYLALATLYLAGASQGSMAIVVGLICSSEAVIITSISVAATPRQRRAGIFEAIERGDVKRVRAILKRQPTQMLSQNCDGSTPLHVAAMTGNDPAVRALLESCPDYVNIRDGRGWTSLHHAAANSDTVTAELLLSHGADVNATISDGQTAIFWAASNGCESLAELLLKHGALLSPSISGLTPLHVSAEQGHLGLVRMFIEAGAEINSRDDDGQTPLAFAEAMGHDEIAGMLRQFGGTAWRAS